jgi:tetratricopeptide (TPR) repeat protein
LPRRFARRGLLWLIIATPIASAASDDFRLGVEAFKQGRYDAARNYFAAAYAAGTRTPTLLYDLGSAQFKLGDYDAAYDSFSRIADDPTWGALAHYNLGLIEERRADGAAAQRHFQAAYDAARSDKLKQLTAAKLALATPAPTLPNWYGIASLAAGYDDNVVLLNDQSLTSVSHKEDYFTEALTSASGYVLGDINRGWRTDFSGYYRRYRDQTDYDYGAVSAGIAYSRITGGAQWQLGGTGDAQFVGGDPYYTSATMRVVWLRPIGFVSVRLRNDAVYIDGASHFGYLTGWQDRFGVQLYGKHGPSSVRVGYELELNDRRDDSTPTEFFSYSPTWNRFYADAMRSLTDAVDLDLRIEYQFSRYADKNVQTNPDGTVQVDARDDDRFTTALRATYHLSADWDVYAEYSYANNSSKFNEYEYDDNQFVIGIERPF